MLVYSLHMEVELLAKKYFLQNIINRIIPWLILSESIISLNFICFFWFYVAVGEKNEIASSWIIDGSPNYNLTKFIIYTLSISHILIVFDRWYVFRSLCR
jgi:hypothetical protein